jgi:hypothetical protein
MIAEIGIIVGLYIIVRMASFLLRKNDRAENMIVKILSIMAIIITFVVIIDLLARGKNITTPKEISGILGYEKKETLKKAEESTKPRKEVTFDPTRMADEGYQDVKWGMNREEVTNLTDAIATDNFLVKETTIIGERAGILYHFAENKLYMVVVAIILETTNNDKYLMKFSELELALINKYGKPKKREFVGSKNRFIPDAVAIASGKGHALSNWETPESKISVELWGDNYKMKLAVRYKSKKYSSLAEKEELEKTKKRIEKAEEQL